MTLRCFGIGGGSPEALIHIILQVRSELTLCSRIPRGACTLLVNPTLVQKSENKNQEMLEKLISAH